jgi:hypothetical protein
MRHLSKADIQSALGALADELASLGTGCELFLAGGAALVLLFDARASTKDVDAFVLDAAQAPYVREAAARVAARLELPSDWLNDAAKGYVHGLAAGPPVFQRRSLTVRTLAPEQLLAMKLSAWRDDIDVEDARLLLAQLGGSREQAWGRVAPHVVPGRELKAQYAFDDLWEQAHGLS